MRKTLILESSAIKKILKMPAAIKAVEAAFKALGRGRVNMPAKIYLDLSKEYNGDFRAMPAYISGLKTCGIKWVNVHPGNRKKGLISVMAIIILSDPANGLPLCVMDGTYITALRTGAAGGVAAKYLARKNSRKVALVGCGAQAETQLLALDSIFDIEEVRVSGLRYSEALRFIRKYPESRRFKMVRCKSVRECVEGCDIVVTTTPSRKPIVKLGWIKKGAHINAIGADAKGKEELEPAILKKAKIVVDAWEQASHSGEINVPLRKNIISRKDVYADIGEVVTGKKGRANQDEITVFDSTGLAIQDMAIASVVFKKALKSGSGRFANFI